MAVEQPGTTLCTEAKRQQTILSDYGVGGAIIVANIEYTFLKSQMVLYWSFLIHHHLNNHGLMGSCGSLQFLRYL